MRRSGVLAVLLVAVAAAVTWYPTWTAPYAEDDHLFLEAVSREGAPGPLHYLHEEGVMDHHVRPIADPLVFMLLHALAGTAPIAYHVLLVLTHLVAAWLVLRLGRELALPAPAPLLAALFYVTRDLAFPSHLWASGFADLGSAAAALGALVLLARWSRVGGAGSLAGATGALVLAQLTKETAVVTVLLAAIVLVLRRVPPTRIAVGLSPLVATGLALAAVQLGAARFEEAGGRHLYELSLGTHALTAWPVYLAWCVAGVAELRGAAAWRWLVIAASYAGVAALAVAAVRRAAWARRALLLVFVWLVAGIAPALLAPQRVHTNYLALASVGPLLALAWAVAAGWRAPRRRLVVAGCATLLAAGPVLAHLKAADRLASGGWVDGTKARRLAGVVDGVHAAAPGPPPDARLLVFGGLTVDVRVLGDPRGLGFGPQQVLASALRVRYGRSDLEVLSLPPLAASPERAYGAVLALLRERPEATRVLVAGEHGVRDLTGTARATAARGGTAGDLRDALVGSYR